MIYIVNHSNNPYYNLALEDYIFDNYKNTDILLLYINTPTIVCSKYQNIFAEANILSAYKKNVALIRRTSGGGTVYHDLGNINYSIIKDASQDALNYDFFLNIVINALDKLNIKAKPLQKSGLEINGYKISGGAQKISKGRIMHHGTLLYDTNLNDILTMANGKSKYYKNKGPMSNPFKVNNIKNFLTNKDITTNDFKNLLLELIKKDFNIKEHTLSSEEINQIKKLSKEKYQNWDWTFGNSPNFEFENNFIYDNINYHINYKAVKGIVTNITINPYIKEIENILLNSKLDYHTLKTTFNNLPKYKDFYKYIF